jgi:hypothetical protein
MNPRFTNFQSKIEICITLPGTFYGADLIWNYPGWKASEKEGFKRWVRNLAEQGKEWTAHNNFENWRLVLIASAGVICEDAGLRDYAFDRWKKILSEQMAVDGRVVREMGRKNSLSYSLYAVNAMVVTAEIARHFGINLYRYKLPDARGLQKTLDYHARFAHHPASWPREQLSRFRGENCALYEIAYSFVPKRAYHAVIDKYGRPMEEIRVMGPVTLTHALR